VQKQTKNGGRAENTLQQVHVCQRGPGRMISTAEQPLTEVTVGNLNSRVRFTKKSKLVPKFILKQAGIWLYSQWGDGARRVSRDRDAEDVKGEGFGEEVSLSPAD